MGAGNQCLAVLLIEDDPTWASLVREMLADATAHCRLTHHFSLRNGISCLQNEAFDVVLLDLNLDDSRGFDTVRTLRTETRIPIVVLTAHENEGDGVTVVRLGADDYVSKEDCRGPLLGRVIRHAAERHEWRRSLEEARQDREVLSLERLAVQQSAAPHTARTMGAGLPLRDSDPDEFAQCVGTYSALLERALEEQLYQVPASVSAQVSDLARRMGKVLSGPRDVLDVHATAVKEAVRGKHGPRRQALLEEARIMVLSLMGHLASHYRNYACGWNRSA